MRLSYHGRVVGSFFPWIALAWHSRELLVGYFYLESRLSGRSIRFVAWHQSSIRKKWSMRRIMAFVSSLIVACALIMGASTEASAKPEDCGPLGAHQYAPTWGSVTTWTNLRRHRVIVRLRLNNDQLRHLRCMVNYVELDVELANSGLSSLWEEYSATTNLPHGIRDTSYLNGEEDNPRPSITNIHTKELQAGRTYFAEFNWNHYRPLSTRQMVRLFWQPSYWEDTWYTPNGVLCQLYGRDPRYCIFGYEGQTAKLHDCFFRAGVPGGWLLLRYQQEVTYRMNFRFNEKCMSSEG